VALTEPPRNSLTLAALLSAEPSVDKKEPMDRSLLALCALIPLCGCARRSRFFGVVLQKQNWSPAEMASS